MLRALSVASLIAVVGCGGDDPSPQSTNLMPVEGAPAGYRRGAMVFDSVRNRAVMFGGSLPPLQTNPTAVTAYGSTYEWDGTSWALVSDSGPSPRFDHTMTYDPVREQVVLFGGYGACSGTGAFDCCSDTWEWNGSSWRSIEAGGPGALRGATSVYDDTTHTIVMFGGGRCDDVGTPNRSVWRYDGSTWTKAWP